MVGYTSILAALPLLSVLPSALAAPDPNTVGFKFEKRSVKADQVPGLRRRQTSGTVQSAISNEVLLYAINVTVGTPGQPIGLQLDTGSSDIWFPASSARECEGNSGNCILGSYNYKQSSTYSDPDLSEFQIQYVDGSGVSGNYITDVLNIGSTKITNLTMAAATTLNGLTYGIMGVGFRSDESSAVTSTGQPGFTFPNLVDVMQSEGLINSRLYSLWLDDLNSNTGSILFGGVDSSKYKGDLIALPIQIDSQSQSITSFTVAWTGLSISGGGNNLNASPSSPQPVVLDSGTSLLYLPNDITEQIFNGVGVISTQNFGDVVPCSLANDDLTFSFTFGGSGGATVNVSLSEFVEPIETQSGQQVHFPNGQAACSFGIQPSGSGPILFGDTFLRSAYVVYDLDSQQVALANANFSPGSSSNVQAVGSSSAIPGVKSTATAASVAQTITGIPHGASAAATGSGDINTDQQTSRSATFKLTASGSSTGSSSGSTSSGAASSNVQLVPLQWQGFASCGVMVLGFLFGGGMLLL